MPPPLPPHLSPVRITPSLTPTCLLWSSSLRDLYLSIVCLRTACLSFSLSFFLPLSPSLWFALHLSTSMCLSLSFFFSSLPPSHSPFPYSFSFSLSHYSLATSIELYVYSCNKRKTSFMESDKSETSQNTLARSPDECNLSDAYVQYTATVAKRVKGNLLDYCSSRSSSFPIISIILWFK